MGSEMCIRDRLTVDPAAVVQYRRYLKARLLRHSRRYNPLYNPSATCRSASSPAAHTAPGRSVISATVGANTTTVAIVCGLCPGRASCVNFVCAVRGGCRPSMGWGHCTPTTVRTVSICFVIVDTFVLISFTALFNFIGYRDC